MWWLLKAEFRKLIRPLVWGTALVIVAFCLLLTWAAARNARAALASPKILLPGAGRPIRARIDVPRRRGHLAAGAQTWLFRPRT
jgi:hypothetical protein